MAAIHGKDTKPEMVVRRWLWSHGYRYRLNHPRLPGKPDVVLRKYRTCIFVNGCFWHGHHVQLQTAQIDNGQLIMDNSECCKIPKTNRAFWVEKIRRNQERDKTVQKKLAEMGWHSITIWECELKPRVRRGRCSRSATRWRASSFRTTASDAMNCRRRRVRWRRRSDYPLNR